MIPKDPHAVEFTNPTWGDLLKCAGAGVFLLFTFVLSLVVFPLFLISGVQIVIRGILVGIRAAKLMSQNK